MKKNILITGASGIVASELISNLLKFTDYRIFAASRHNAGYEAPVYNILNEQIERCLQENEFDCLIHCAYPRNVSETQWASGLDFGITVLFLARKYNVKRIVHVSSQSIYGWKRNIPAVEGDTIVLNNPYGTGKYCTELIVKQIFADRLYTNVRLATVIGERTEERVPNKFIHHLIDGDDLNIQGGGQIFSFLDARDAGEALCKLIVSEKEDWCEIYNVGTEEYYSLLEIAEMCLSISKAYGNRTSKVLVHPADFTLNNRMDCSLFHRDFNWKAKHKLNETIEDIYQSYLRA
ncbi:MAG: NAD(P)-dependent oxidoreductase [Clostridiales bacterium]|nr:NAD(P)-dependent oxidoreductase [Clostridiales bacterium]